MTQSANGNTNSNLTNITNNNGASTAPLVTPLNNNILNNDTSQPNPTDEKKSTPVSNRAKPISCLTFSPDGHYLAAGEVGISSDPNPIYKKKKRMIHSIKSIIIDGPSTENFHLGRQGKEASSRIQITQVWCSFIIVFSKHAISSIYWISGIFCQVN